MYLLSIETLSQPVKITRWRYNGTREINRGGRIISCVHIKYSVNAGQCGTLEAAVKLLLVFLQRSWSWENILEQPPRNDSSGFINENIRKPILLSEFSKSKLKWRKNLSYDDVSIIIFLRAFTSNRTQFNPGKSTGLFIFFVYRWNHVLTTYYFYSFQRCYTIVEVNGNNSNTSV